MGFRPPYYQAASFAEGIKRMTPTTWPVVLGFAITTTLMLTAHNALKDNPAVKAKSVYYAQVEAAQGKAPEGHGHGGHH